MTYVPLFIAAAMTVFFQAVQSIAVNRGHRLIATLNSFAIAVSFAYVLHAVIRSDSIIAAIVWGAGGAVGCNLAMTLAKWMRHK